MSVKISNLDFQNFKLMVSYTYPDCFISNSFDRLTKLVYLLGSQLRLPLLQSLQFLII